MSNFAIEVHNMSKLYRLGEVGTGTLSHDLNRWWHKIRGKEDPYTLIGDENDRTESSTTGYVWALKDIDFKVEQGQILGIIGKNGAGKSTLLKILSHITGPTTGSVRMHGRVASLLEIGTGMHPELTGRENIMLNGAILGMTKNEIFKKFDEIVDFSGCAKYIDTPIKRYSSGMKVRLGFAVAAFLEPEILIVDEVLAVGDAEFQKRAIGKMKNVTEGGGRTVLFVSHNMASLKQLCPQSLLIENGRIKSMGETNAIIDQYLDLSNDAIQESTWKRDPDNPQQTENPYFMLEEMHLLDEEGKRLNRPVSHREKFIYAVFTGRVDTADSRLNLGFTLRDDQNNILINNYHTDAYPEEKILLPRGMSSIKVRIPVDILNEGNYYVDFTSALWCVKMLHTSEMSRISVKFNIEGLRGDQAYYSKKRQTILAPYLTWSHV